MSEESRYYKRDGTACSLKEWSALFENVQYCCLALTELPNSFEVSTVWLGLNHNYREGPPLIFETMVFSAGSREEKDTQRYSTEAQALDGHKIMVEKWKHCLGGSCGNTSGHKGE